MSSRIQWVLKLFGIVGIVLWIGFVLASPFLPLSPFWQQAMVGVTIVVFYLCLLTGPMLSRQISLLRERRTKQAGNTRFTRLPKTKAARLSPDNSMAPGRPPRS